MVAAVAAAIRVVVAEVVLCPVRGEPVAGHRSTIDSSTAGELPELLVVVELAAVRRVTAALMIAVGVADSIWPALRRWRRSRARW